MTLVLKCQGSTHDEVVLNIEGLSRSALYVGCSRARTLGGLYLEGEFKAPTCLENDPVEVEMSKVQARKLTFCKTPDPKSTILSLTQNQIPVRRLVSQDLNLIHLRSPSFVDSMSNSSVELLDHLTDIPINALITKIGNVSIYQEDLASLSPGAWLTDAVRFYSKINY